MKFPFSITHRRCPVGPTPEEVAKSAERWRGLFEIGLARLLDTDTRDVREVVGRAAEAADAALEAFEERWAR